MSVDSQDVSASPPSEGGDDDPTAAAESGPRVSPFESSVEELDGARRRVTITASAERVERVRAAERQRLAGSVRLKGFRRGKIPTDLLEKRYGDVLDERTVRALLDQSYRAAIQEHDLRPIGEAELGDVQYARGERLTFQIEVPVLPRLDLQRVGGFSLERPIVQISDGDVDEVLDNIRLQHGEWEPLQAQPEEGDRVSVEIAPAGPEPGGDAGAGGEAAGNETTGDDETRGETRNYEFVLGEGYAVPGVEASIRSLTPGTAGDFDVAFPTGGEGEADVVRRLHIRLVEASRQTPAEPSDAFAAEVGDFSSLEELREAIRTDLRRHQEEAAERGLRDRLLDAIIEANPFPLPAALADESLDRAIGAPEGADPEEVRSARESLRPHIETQIRRRLVLDRLIEREGLEPTPGEVESRLAHIARGRGETPDELRRELARDGRLDEVARQLAVEKAFDYLKPLSGLA